MQSVILLLAAALSAGEWGQAPNGEFWKKSAFDDSYPPAERTFALAYRRVMDAYLNMDQTKYLIRHGRPDPDYYLSGYPSKMLAAQALDNLAQAEREDITRE